MVGDGRCTFGTRMPLDIHMLNEMIHREQKHFLNYKTYTPNFGSIPVTGKFYARHDQLADLDDTDGGAGAEAARRGEEYCERVAQARALGPRARCDQPATENQVYGWYGGPIYPLDRGDRRFFHPRRESAHTKVAVVIRTSNPRDRKQGA